MKTTLITGFVLICLIILISLIKEDNIPQNKPITATIGGKKYNVVKNDIDTVYVIKTAIKKVKGDVILKDTIIYVHIPSIIDTGEILKGYFSKAVFRDTLKIDSFGYVAIRDTISENKILNREYRSSVKSMIVNKTMVVSEPKRTQLYVGLGSSFDKLNLVNGLNANILIKTKNDRAFSLGVGVDHTSTPFVSTMFYWKIR
tara:strand:- start:455 stop:1057 length:603 start_codon:yes stop_codon:yes gene_type:complete